MTQAVALEDLDERGDAGACYGSLQSEQGIEGQPCFIWFWLTFKEIAAMPAQGGALEPIGLL